MPADAKEFLDLLQQWHANRTGQLRQIMEHKDADITVDGITIAAGSDMAKGVRFGVGLALHLMGDLPFTVTKRR